jgi:hypothetical protein
MLFEEGRFALNDPIARWAAGFSEMRVLRSPTAPLDPPELVALLKQTALPNTRRCAVAGHIAAASCARCKPGASNAWPRPSTSSGRLAPTYTRRGEARTASKPAATSSGQKRVALESGGTAAAISG